MKTIQEIADGLKETLEDYCENGADDDVVENLIANIWELVLHI
jgi:hypothetical protein